MNTKVISELKKLNLMIKKESDEHRKNKEKKEVTRNNFRTKYLNNVINIIENLEYKLTLKNYIDLKEFCETSIELRNRFSLSHDITFLHSRDRSGFCGKMTRVRVHSI